MLAAECALIDFQGFVMVFQSLLKVTLVVVNRTDVIVLSGQEFLGVLWVIFGESQYAI